MATYSFHETKNVFCGEGGALALADERLAERAEILREKGTNRHQFFRGQVDKYTWIDLGSSYLLSELLAAFLFAQLESMQRITEKRRQIYALYQSALAPLEARDMVTLPQVPAYCGTNCHMFHILLRDEETRARLIEHLKNRGIQAVFHYVPLHSSPMGQNYGYRKGMLPITENVSERLLRLPMFYDLEVYEQERVIEAIYAFYGAAQSSP